MVRETRDEATMTPRPCPDHAAQPNASSGAPPDKDRCLVLRAQDGDTNAFEQFVGRYQDRLFRTTYMIVRNRHDSKGIIQDTPIQTWHSLHLVREPAAFRGWLMRVCTSKAINMARKRQCRATGACDTKGLETASTIAETTSSSTADPAGSSEVNAQIEALADLLASVQPELRIVWVLREVGDMSYEEVAQTLNLTESTVQRRLARARSLAVRQMKGWT